jgi:hypothetical protein
VKAYEKRFGPMNSRSAASFTAMMTVAPVGGRYVDVYPDDLAARPVIWPLALARK